MSGSLAYEGCSKSVSHLARKNTFTSLVVCKSNPLRSSLLVTEHTFPSVPPLFEAFLEYSLAVVFRIMSSHDSNRVPFSYVFRWGNSQKSQRAMSGEYGACPTTRMWCLAKKVLISCKKWAGALSWCSCHVSRTLSAWTNHRSKWNVPNQCLSQPPLQVLGLWHDGPAWQKSALGQWTRHFETCWGSIGTSVAIHRRAAIFESVVPLLNLCDAHGIVPKKYPLYLPNGFHLAIVKLLAKFNAIPLFESFRHFRRK